MFLSSVRIEKQQLGSYSLISTLYKWAERFCLETDICPVYIWNKVVIKETRKSFIGICFVPGAVKVKSQIQAQYYRQGGQMLTARVTKGKWNS